MQLNLFDCIHIDGPSPGSENSKIWTPPEETESSSSSAFSDKSVRKYLDGDKKKEAKRQENRRYRSKKKQLKRAEVETVLLPLQSLITSYRTSYVDALAEVRAFYKAQPLPKVILTLTLTLIPNPKPNPNPNPNPNPSPNPNSNPNPNLNS